MTSRLTLPSGTLVFLIISVVTQRGLCEETEELCDRRSHMMFVLKAVLDFLYIKWHMAESVDDRVLLKSAVLITD